MKKKTLKIIGIAGVSFLAMGVAFFIAFWITGTRQDPPVPLNIILTLLACSICTGIPGILMSYTFLDKRDSITT